VSRWPLAVLVVTAVSCRSGTSVLPEAGVEIRPPDAAVARDAMPTALAVDFTVADCPTFGAGPRCRGGAPLTVQFVPVTTGAVTKYLWNFGDGTDLSSARTPVHTYPFPGSYDVVLVGGGAGGSAMRTRTGYVVVVENGAGDPCDVDQQCERGLSCVCGSTAKCTGAFARGLCAATCGGSECRASERCADLSQGSPDAGEPWQQPLCLRPCQGDTDCGPPLRCRDLPGRAPGAAWLRGCFPDFPTAPGGRCRGASGQLQDGLCVTGHCMDLGAAGICSLDCTSASCPPRMACAALADGRHACLALCGPGLPCDDDPLLACLPPNAGPLGYTLPPGTPPSMYCAPRRCASADDCAPAGTCRMGVGGGHCVRKGG
jgi:PKD repeat protein